jgi:uncharacterized membrane protein
MQAWTSASPSAAAAFDLAAASDHSLASHWKRLADFSGDLVGCAALFRGVCRAGKIEDRMAADAPHTLDGMAYMQYSHYGDQDTDMILPKMPVPFYGCRTIYRHPPVIVEANT